MSYLLDDRGRRRRRSAGPIYYLLGALVVSLALWALIAYGALILWGVI